MKDLKLDSCGDLFIENGDLSLISGTAEVKQRILVYLRTGLEEYFWDVTKGVPYHQKVFQKNLSKSELKTIFRTITENIEGVHEVTEVTITEYNPNTRAISVQLDIVLDSTLEQTTLLFTGIIPNECDLDPLFPSLLGNCLVWFDAQHKIFENRAGAGSFSLIGDTELKGQTSLDLNNRGINNPSAGAASQNYISFIDTPFLNDLSAMTIIKVFRTNSIPNSIDIGFFCLKGYKKVGASPAEELVYNFYLKDTTVSKFTAERRLSGGTVSADITIPSFENSNLIIAIRVNRNNIEVFVNGVSVGSFSFTYFESTCYTSGDGYLFCSKTYDDSFINSLNGDFGEFLIYEKVLSDIQINELTSWLQTKWNLV